MTLLIRLGEASTFALEMLLSENTAAAALKVHISHLRKELAKQGVAVQILNIHGWGYRLIIEA